MCKCPGWTLWHCFASCIIDWSCGSYEALMEYRADVNVHYGNVLEAASMSSHMEIIYGTSI